MATFSDYEKFYIEKEEVCFDSDDECKYEEVPIEEDLIITELEEDFESAVRTIREANEDSEAKQPKEAIVKPDIIQKPEVVDDFVRNFLVRMGLFRSLDCFQTEWYELQEKGQLNYKDIGTVPDIYTRNQELDDEISFLQKEANKYRVAAQKAKETYVKLRKERDFHRMHHKRIIQEKNKLIDDIRRLKSYYAEFAPNLNQLKTKYETAMREKMLATLERDRAVNQVQGLQSTLKNMEGSTKTEVKEEKHPTQKALLAERQKRSELADGDVKKQEKDFKRYVNDSDFPVDTGVNPLLNLVKSTCPSARTSVFRQTSQFPAHTLPISGLSMHPRKQVLATSSDDNTWKMHALPNGDLIMTGEGHTDWVSDCAFHPLGSTLATTSGDTTVKIWDFTRAACVHTFTDHSNAVWACSWHNCGDFLATCSMDNTIKIFDVNSLRCRMSLRGHADSVNSVEFLPFSNTLVSGSADKTLSLWDARTSICAQTFYGHNHSVNSATFNLKGDTIASCDSFGVVKLWDVRSVAPTASVELGPHSANQIKFDPSGTFVAVAGNDSAVKVYEVQTGSITSLVGHEDAVQCLLFDISGNFLVSGGSDSTVRIWS